MAAVAPTWHEGHLVGAVRAKSGSNARSKESDLTESARLAVILALWCAIWLTLLCTVSLSPPQDNVGQLTWVRSPEWGYYKHPPLPTILLWPWVHLFGLHAHVTYVLGALMTVSAVCICWRLVRHTSGAHVAWLSTLGTLCITYYNGRLDYNHNIVLLLLVTVSAYCCWQSFARQSLVAWAGVGLALGLGVITKYQVVLVVVSVVCVWTVQGGWRLPVHRRGLALAMAIALFIFLPHGLWLLEHDFLAVRYAMTTSLAADLPAQSRWRTAMAWMADQLNRLVPALLLGAAA